MRNSKVRLAAALVAAGALSLTAACSSGNGGGGNGGGDKGSSGGPKATVPNYGLGTAADSTGPAPAVPGAVKGGTVQDLDQAGFDYLDPGQQYVSDQLSVSTLYARTLTGYKIDPTTGKTILVGDLATDTGKMSDGGKTWTYTLKDGLKFEGHQVQHRAPVRRLRDAGPAVHPVVAVRPGLPEALQGPVLRPGDPRHRPRHP
jgi:peptide/nickel transport system substrate-binding protein